MKSTLTIDNNTELIENRFVDMVNFIYEHIQHYKINRVVIEIDTEFRKIEDSE